MTPEIHEWWPSLSIQAKHALRALDDEAIPARVRDEIADITGTVVPEEARLEPADAEFIRTQREIVD
ncbi:hypothetical protein [Microbacterium sp. ZW T5_56]|uniref:hypothetical protein n=1 Tax=Microbacterium sp. ZW T5_56 TaxID=3378081 RepID=UPI0038552825